MAQASLPPAPARVRHTDASRLPKKVVVELGRLEGRIKSLSAISGLAITLLMVTALAAVTFVLDWWLDLSSLGRMVALGMILVTGLGGTLWAFKRYLFRLPLPELAAAVEEKHPEFGERLISLVEFSHSDVDDKAKGSELMQTLLERETLKLVAPTEFTAVVDHSRAAWRSLFAAAAVVLLLLPFLGWKDTYQLLWSRLLTPWNNFERPSNLVFDIPQGDRVAPRGEDVKIVAIPVWRNKIPEPISEVRMNWAFDGAGRENRRMAWDEGASAYSTILPAVQTAFTYSVSAPGAKSREYRMRVEDRPVVESLSIDVQPPGYTGLPAEHWTASALEIRAFEHSQITLTTQINKAVRHLDLVWLEQKGAAMAAQGRAIMANSDSAEAAGVVLDPVAPVVVPNHLQGRFPGWDIRAIEPLTVSSDGRSGSIAFSAERPGRFVLHAVDEFDLNNPREPIRSLDIRLDQPPAVDFADNNDSGTARPDEVVQIPVFAQDDIGLAALELHVKSFPEGKTLKSISVPQNQLGVTEIGEAFALNLAEFGLQPDDVISVRARAADAREIPGPNETWTHDRLIRVQKESLPYGFETIAQERAEWKADLQQILNEIIANRTEVQDIQKSVETARQQNQSFDRDSQVPRLAEAEREIADKAEKLAATLADHPLFENLAPALKDAAEDDLHPAADKTDSVPQTTELPAKEASLKQAIVELNEAEQRLRALEEKFDKAAALERDLFELQRLAARTEQLAKDTEKYEDQRDVTKTPEAERTPDSPQPFTPEEQQRQKDDLLTRHDSLSKDLNSLLQKRPELLTAAQEELLKQLQELFDRAAELANREDKLGEALAKEAQQNAIQLAPQQQKQQDLQAKAQDLLAEQELTQAQQVAKPLDLNDFEQAMDELTAGDSQQAAEAQKQAAADLEKLAEALERNSQLPADPREAAQELAKRQEDLKNQLQALTQKERDAEQVRREAQQKAPNQPLPQELLNGQKPLERERRDLALEQAALQAATAQLDVPRHADDPQRDAVQRGQEAVRQLLKEEPNRKAETAQQATDAAARAKNDIDQLVQRIGTPEERQQRAFHEARGISDDQKALARQMEDLRKQQATGKPVEQLADAIKQSQQKQLEIAQRLADIEPIAPDAAQQAARQEQLEKALEKVAEAMTDLQQQNLASTDATQSQAAQALQDLRNQLEGKPTAEEALKSAQQKQTEIAQAADKAQEAGDQRGAQLHQQKDQQRELARQLEQMETPAAPALRDAARQAAHEAADALDRAANDPQQFSTAEQAMDRSQNLLNELAEAVNPEEQASTAAAKALAQEQAAEAKAAQESAVEPSAPTMEAVTAARDELRERQQDLSELRAPVTAQAEKMAAQQALEQAAQKEDALQALLKNQPKTPEGTPMVTPELQTAEQAAAQQQQNAAQALQQLAEKLNQPEAVPALAETDQGDERNAMALEEPRIAELQALAEKASALADQQEALQAQASEAMEKNAENPEAQKQALQQQRGAQQQLAQAVRDLPQAAAPQARAEAQNAAEAAEQALVQQNGEAATDAQEESAEALHQLAEQAKRQAEALTEQAAQAMAAAEPPMGNAPAESPAGNPPAGVEPQPGQPKGTEPQPAPSATPQPTDPKTGLAQLAERARELAAEQRALAAETEQAGDENALAMNQSPAEDSAPAGDPNAPQPSTSDPANPGNMPPANAPGTPMPAGTPAEAQPAAPEESVPEQLLNALREQQKLALEAREMALNTELQSGAESAVAKAATEFAEQAAEAAQELAAGGIPAAAEAGQQAAESGEQAAQEFRQQPPSQGGANEQMAASTEQLAQKQAAIAENLAELQQSAAARRTAQRQAQQQLRQETQQLTNDLAKVAESFSMQPLQQQGKAQEAEASETSAEQAQAAMQSAQQNLNQSNPAEAAEQAAEAAQALRDAGKLATASGQPGQQGKPGQSGKPGQQGQPNNSQGQPPQDSAVPAEGALTVAQAAQQLNQIGQQLANDQGQAGEQGQPGQQPGDMPPEGQSNAGEGNNNASPMEGEPQQANAETQNGQQQGSQGNGPSKASDSLKQTASNLRQAMAQFGMPSGQKPGKPNGKPSTQEAKGSQEGENMSDFGNSDEARIVELENHLKGLSTRNWGELPGSLKTEILQAARKKPDGDYAKLVRKYFDEISKTQRPEEAAAPQSPAEKIKP